MIPIRDHVILQADKDKKSTFQFGTLKLYKELSFRPYEKENVTQDAVVIAAPHKLSTGGKPQIKEGDTVIGHHFMCDKENQVEEKGHYKILYQDLYCKITPGEEPVVEMLSDWNFVLPIEEVIKTTLIIPDSCKKKEPCKGIMAHPSKQLKEMGVKQGDIIFFAKNMDYEIDVCGITHYRIKDNYILGTEKAQ